VIKRLKYVSRMTALVRDEFKRVGDKSSDVARNYVFAGRGVGE